MEEAYNNWLVLQDYSLEFRDEEDQRVFGYLKDFYGQMSAPPDFPIIRDFFEKQDDIEAVNRLEDISKSQFHIRQNFLAIVRSEQEQQQIKELVILCRDASAIAEHGRTDVDPRGGKVTRRGVRDAVNYMFDHLHDFVRIEGGEKLEGVITEDAEEVLDEYDKTEQTDKFAGRNLFGLEPVDAVCRGHRRGEFWVHTAFVSELKCLSGSATVLDYGTGRRRTLKDLYDSQEMPVLSSLKDEGRGDLSFVREKASHIIQNGVRPVFRLLLESGRRTVSTSNHKFLTLDGWKELGDVSSGEWVAVPKVMAAPELPDRYKDEEVKAIGYLIGDGTISGYISLTASNEEVRSDFCDCLSSLGYKEGPADFSDPNFKKTDPGNRAPGVRVSHSKGDRNHRQVSPLRHLLSDLKMWGSTASTKRVPDELMGLSERQTSLLLGSLWATDGSVHTDPSGNRTDLKYYSICEGLCLDVQSLLLRLCIAATVSRTRLTWNGEEREVFVTRVVGNLSKRKFLNSVSVPGKDYRLDLSNRTLPDRDDTMYPTAILPDGASAVMGTGKRRYKSQMFETSDAFVLDRFRGQGGVDRFLDGDVLWERVRSVEPAGKEMTYDLEVPIHHSFVVDDIVCHNTTLALNYAYNNVMVYGKNIFYAILEMPYKQLRRQLYLIHSSHGKFVTEWHKEDGYVGLDYRSVRDGELSPRDRERLSIVARDFKETTRGKLYVWRPNDDVSVQDIRHKAEMFDNKYGCDGIVLDHMGLIKPRKGFRDTVSSLNDIVRESRLMALNFARGKTVPVLGLFQMNRQGKLRADKADGRYDIAAISYANEIEKSADVISYTYLNDHLRKEAQYYLGCLKNRDNPPFDRMIGKILWNSKRMRAIEQGMLDLDADRIVAASDAISVGMEELYSYSAGGRAA